MIKTYGVSGLMDWTTQIKVGKGTVSVHFTGGALTAYGVTPAKYSTSNTFFQNVIENSEQFKSGRIQLLGIMNVAEDSAPKASKARLATHSKEVLTTANEAIPTSESQISEEVAIKIKVPDKMEAIEYLKEHFAEKNYTATGLRTKTAFEAACKECGVEFEFIV